MFLRIALLLAATSAYLHGSTVTVIGGSPPPLQEGTYISLYGFEEEYDYDSSDYSYTTTAYLNSEIQLSASVGSHYAVGNHEYEYRAVLNNAPDGMSAIYNGSVQITWQCPHVLERTRFNFDFGVELLIDGEIVETLTESHTISVIPALPVISNEELSFIGLRPQDPNGGTASIYLSDPDEEIDGDELGILTQDPRLFFTLNTANSYPFWNVTWNDNFAPPLVTEIVPIQFSLKDFDGTGTRRTPQIINTSIFGFSYENTRLQAPTPSDQGFFGSSVAISGDTAFVAEEGSAVYIYTQNTPGNWTLSHTISSPSNDRNFGSSLASSGPFLAVSAVALDDSITGAVYIYRYYSETEEWQLTQTLTPDESEHADFFGGDIGLTQPRTDISHYTLMVSADGGSSNGAHTGAVWVYDDTTVSSSSSNFEKRQVIVPEEAEGYDYFGWPLTLKGDIAVLPANEDDDLWLDSGAVYVYRRDQLTGIWSLQQKLKASDPYYNDLFGERVTISEQGIFIASFRKNIDYVRIGGVYQFKEVDGQWLEQRRIRTIEEQITSTWSDYNGFSPVERIDHTIRRFGSSIEADGNTLLIASRRIGQSWPNFDRSVVYQFEWNEAEQVWNEVRALCGSDTDTVDMGEYGKVFGEEQMLAINGDHIIVGDFGSESNNVPDSGLAYIFNTHFAQAERPAAPYPAFHSQLARVSPEADQPDEDADGDRISNLHEFFAGTDPLEQNSQIMWPATRTDTISGTPEYLYYFRQSKDTSMLQPTFYASNTLAPNSWRKVEAPLYGTDIDSGNYLIRCIDISDEIDSGNALFLKMSLNPTDVSE
jgi:hypothetical protein